MSGQNIEQGIEKSYQRTQAVPTGVRLRGAETYSIDPGTCVHWQSSILPQKCSPLPSLLIDLGLCKQSFHIFIKKNHEKQKVQEKVQEKQKVSYDSYHGILFIMTFFHHENVGLQSRISIKNFNQLIT